MGRPDLVVGFRITEALFEAVAKEACTQPFLAVGYRHGLDRATVRKVWNTWRSRLKPGRTRVEVADVFDVDAGDRTLVVARDAETSRLAGVFEDAHSPDLIRWIRDASPEVVVVGMRHAPFVSAAVPSAVAAVDPSSVRTWFAEQVSKACRMAPFPVPSAVAHALRLPFVVRGACEDASLEEFVSRGGDPACLVLALDGLRRLFEHGGPSLRRGGRPVRDPRLRRHLAACGKSLAAVAPLPPGVDRVVRIAAGTRRAGAGVPDRFRGEDVSRLSERIEASAIADRRDRADPPEHVYVWEAGRIGDMGERGRTSDGPADPHSRIPLPDPFERLPEFRPPR